MRGVWGVCGVRGSVGRAWKCGTCRGVRVCVLGVCVVYMVWGAWDVRGVYVCVWRKERVSLAPLYYPDALVNPDTCLGVTFCQAFVKFVRQNCVCICW